MKTFVDDPRLTAYALGEIDDTERAEVESLLQRSPDARRWVESVQQTSARLSAALKEELGVTGYELRVTNDELRMTNDELASDSSLAANSSVIDNRKSSIDNTSNRSLAFPALKRHRIVRLIPFALAASVAVASGVTYVVWNQTRNSQIESAVRTDLVVDFDPVDTAVRDVAPNMRTGIVQVTPVDGENISKDLNGDGQAELLNGLPLVFGAVEMVDFDPYVPEVVAEVGSAVRTDLVDSNTVTQTGTLVLSNIPSVCSAGPNWTAETGMTETPLKLDCDPVVTEPTPSGSVAVIAQPFRDITTLNLASNADIDGTNPTLLADTRTASNSGTSNSVGLVVNSGVGDEGEMASARAINGSVHAANLPQVVIGISPGRYTDTIEQIRQRDAEAAGMVHYEIPIETMHYNLSNTGAISPEDFALAVDSLDGINDSGRLSETRFTSGGYGTVDRDIVSKSAAGGSPQIGLKTKPNMDLRAATVREQMYAQQRGALIDVPAPGSGQSVFGGSSGGASPVVDPVTNQPVLPDGRAFHKIGLDPNHAPYDIKVPTGQYGSITARDQASTIRSIADVEAMQAAVGEAPPKHGNGLPYDQSRARVSTSNFDEGAPIRAPRDRDNSANDAGTNVTSGYGSKSERDRQYVLEHQKNRTITRSISQTDGFQDIGTAATTLNSTSRSGGDVADDYLPVSSKIAMEVNVGGGNLNVSDMDLAYVPGGLGCYPDITAANQAAAEFKGDPFFGGNWLVGNDAAGSQTEVEESKLPWNEQLARPARNRDAASGVYYFAGGRTLDADMPGSFAGTPLESDAQSAFWKAVRDGDVTVKQFIVPSATDDAEIVDYGYDFSAHSNISFGYQVPFGPPGAEPSTTKAGAKFYGFNPANAGEVEAGVPALSRLDEVAHLYFKAPNCGFCRKQVPHTAHSVDPVTAESYDPVIEIPFLFVENQPLSTFSIDVDTASYTNVRRMLNQNVLPPHGAVRVEEMINYFDYDYSPPSGADPFSVNVAVAECPWNPEHRLARIGIKGKVFTDRNRPAANLVFLVDVSGSMNTSNKLPLVRHGLRAMVEQLTARDSVAIVTYADGSNVALPATSARNKQTILDAVDRLMSGGGTNGGAGIETAYQLASEHYVEGGANRVILATDGDFNVGVTRQDELVSLIEEKAATGVFLSVLGFGMGNIKDSMLEKLADKGNGLYAYIDDDVEAERVLVDQMGGTLVTIAKDVKIQVEFNPAEVGAYRLIGYENRMLRAQDFNNDAKDAGEIGAGHTVTALYEIVPAGMQAHEPGVDPLKYQGGGAQVSARAEGSADDTDEVKDDELVEGTEVVDANETETSEPRPQGSGQRIVDGRVEVQPDSSTDAADGEQSPPYVGEMMTVKLRYKDPEGDVSKLIELPVTDEGLAIDDASDDFVFAASVASFGMMLRGSAHTPGLTFDSVLEMAKSSMGEDPFGYREEFIQLVEKAKTLSTTANQK